MSGSNILLWFQSDLNAKDIERAKFAFDIYDFEGKSRMDMFYLGDCLRGLNLNPTLKMIDKLGGAKKKGEKFIKLEEVISWTHIFSIPKISCILQAFFFFSFWKQKL